MNSGTSSNSSSEDHGPVFCEKFQMQVISTGIFAGSNPIHSTLPLLLLKLGLVSSLAGLLQFLLRPLGVPKHVTDILSGILLGPSGIGRNQKIFDTLFAPKGAMVLDVYETLCMILFSFFIGLRTDVKVVKRGGGLALTMGILCSLLPQLINAIVLRFLTRDVPDDSNLSLSLSVVAGLEGLINFHVVFLTLSDMKFVNIDVGRVALSSSMISGFLSWIMIMLRRLVRDAVHGHTILVIATPVCRAVMILFAVYVIRPVMFWMISKTPEGKTLKHSYVCSVILILFGLALYSEVTGMHHVFSSILLGLVVPDGSALQSGLVDKLEGFVSGILMPSFTMNVGRKVDIYKLKRSTVGKVEVLVATSILGKLAASMIASTFWDMALTDAFLIGLLVTCQGIFDIQFFTVAEKIEKLSTECFTVIVIMAILIPTIVTPIVPVAKMSTVRAVLAVAAMHDWDATHMDVSNAFLHGTLNEAVYMRFPQGYTGYGSRISHAQGEKLAHMGTNLVCKLLKTLYGLRQAPHEWFDKLSETLLSTGFVHSKADYSLFTKVTPASITLVLIYVDDLLITGNCNASIKDLKSVLSGTFHMKDLGPVTYFLGLEIDRTQAGFLVSQKKYVLDLLTEFGMLSATP